MAKTKGIYQMKDKDGHVIPNKWFIVAYLKNPATGRSQRATKVYNGGKRGAVSLRADMLANPANYIDVGGQAPVTFAAYAAEWLEQMSLKAKGGSISERRVADLEKYLDKMSAHLGKLQLDEIDARIIKKMLADIRKAKSARLGRPVSEKTMGKTYGALNQLMQSAYIDGLIDANPCWRVETPSSKSNVDSDTRALEPDEIAVLVAALNANESAAYKRFYAKEQRLVDGGHAAKERHGLRNVMELSRLMAVRLALVAGLRRGELCALRWGDISFIDASVTVRHSLTTHGDLKSTKACNVGVLPLDDDTLQRLSRLQDFQLECMRLLKIAGDGDTMPPDRFVVCSDILGATDPDNLSAWVRKWRKDTDGVPRDLHLQMLRATFGTELSCSMPIADTARALRHESPRTTLSYYTKSRRANDRRPAEIMARYTMPDDVKKHVLEGKTV